jgi:hypothetical protein
VSSWANAEKIFRSAESALDKMGPLDRRVVFSVMAASCEELLWSDELRGKNDLQCLLIDLREIFASRAKGEQP